MMRRQIKVTVGTVLFGRGDTDIPKVEVLHRGADPVTVSGTARGRELTT